VDDVDRREFIKSATVLASLAAAPALRAQPTQPEIAFTFDDPRTDAGAGLSWQQINERILDVLAKRGIKGVLFVCGKRVDSDAGKSLIAAWDRAGHDIGNHSYSHLNLNTSSDVSSGGGAVTLAEFEADALKNEPLLRPYSHLVRLFRYPYFKEGDTMEKRDGMRSFLRQHGYRAGRATIDASDWAISGRLEKRKKENPQADLTAYRDFFLQHIWERAQFYDSLARRVLNHPVRHTVLLHHNALNALFLDSLVAMFISNGWKPVDAQRAYADPVYDLQPNILPAGESLVWALAKQTGKFEQELRYPGEDDVYENPKMDALKL
jgi:peptidoglycan/xylan/chitin deacetylase (PgdA/CDA1 family)